MYLLGPNYPKLKTSLRLAIFKLKLLQRKKIELNQKRRKEIADLIYSGKLQKAKYRVQHIICEDYLIDALEMIEMYCDLLLAKFELMSNMKEVDDGLAEAVSGLIWAAPRLTQDVQELKVIAKMLVSKYGSQYGAACREDTEETVSKTLKEKLAITSPTKVLVEKYMIEIARSYHVSYEPDLKVMTTEQEEETLVELELPSSTFGGTSGSGSGFLDYFQPPSLVSLVPNTVLPTDFLSNNMPPNEHQCKENSSGGMTNVTLPHIENNEAKLPAKNTDDMKDTPKLKIRSNDYNSNEVYNFPGPPSAPNEKIYDMSFVQNNKVHGLAELPYAPNDKMYELPKNIAPKKAHDLSSMSEEHTPPNDLSRLLPASSKVNHDPFPDNDKVYNLPKLPKIEVDNFSKQQLALQEIIDQFSKLPISPSDNLNKLSQTGHDGIQILPDAASDDQVYDLPPSQDIVDQLPKLPSVPIDDVYVLPRLPSVPNLDVEGTREDVDFDELCRRFNELKKK